MCDSTEPTVKFLKSLTKEKSKGSGYMALLIGLNSCFKGCLFSMQYVLKAFTANIMHTTRGHLFTSYEAIT